jgi:hypothetical protein
MVLCVRGMDIGTSLHKVVAVVACVDAGFQPHPFSKGLFLGSLLLEAGHRHICASMLQRAVRLGHAPAGAAASL